MMRLLCTALIAGSMIVPALAAVTAPTLPATAKKLTGAEITALYDGALITWDNFTQKEEMTGTATLDREGALDVLEALVRGDREVAVRVRLQSAGAEVGELDGRGGIQRAGEVGTADD
jgi:hypothetical protein